MQISVIIPTYKPQAYLWECLDSLNAQSYSKKQFEVILILNGCNNPYFSQISDYIAKKLEGLNINFIQVDEGGVSNARNIGLDYAKGDYIMFLDDDDFLSPATLEELSRVMNQFDVVIFKPLAFYDGNKSYFEYSRSFEYNAQSHKNKVSINQVRKNFSGPVMKLFPKSIIGDRRYNVNFLNGEDSLFMFLISNKIGKCVFASDEAIYYRRVRENSAATTNKSLWYVIKNSCSLIREYTYIYMTDIKNYNFIFFATRVLAALKAILFYKKKTY